MVKFVYCLTCYISQVGCEGGSKLLAPWPEAMALIALLPLLPGWGKRNYAAGHVLMRPSVVSLVPGAVSNGSSGLFLSEWWTIGRWGIYLA